MSSGYDLKRLEPGDLLIHEESSIVCRESVSIVNALGAITAVNHVGMPVTDNGDGTADLINAAGQANANAVILDGPPLTGKGNGTYGNYSILRRGPAAINKDRIAKTDPVGGAFTEATLVAALLDEGIVSRDVPPESSKQTT